MLIRGSITDSSIIPTMMDSMMTSVGSTVAMMLETDEAQV